MICPREELSGEINKYSFPVWNVESTVSETVRWIFFFIARAWMESNEYLFYMIFLALWIFGILGNIISPLINIVSDLLISGVGKLFGL